MTTTPSLPHWNMSVVYPSLASPEFAQAFEQCVQKIAQLRQLFDEHSIDRQERVTVDDALAQTLETVVQRYNAVLDLSRTVSVYIRCFVDTNSHDSLAQAKMSELEQHTVLLAQLGMRFTAWIGSLDGEALIERSSIASEHAFVLRTMKEQAAHLMTPAEEALAAELNVSGGSAWMKLHGNLTSQLTVELEVEGQLRTLPMSTLRNMAYEKDRDLRRRAYEAELLAWSRVAVPLTAAMNSIKSEVNILARRRKWSSPLDATLFGNRMDRAMLDAMLSAARYAFPDFRRYLHAKAKALHLKQLAWYDLFAPMPLGGETKHWSFAESADFIVEHFGSYSPHLADFAARAFREQWIDAEPRGGKRDGGYCEALRGEESRIFTNFHPSFDGMSTVAHELGHAYHYMHLAQRTPLQRFYPMTLDETASTFCETIIYRAALEKANEQEQMTLLEYSLQDACQIVVDITSRLLFEQRVFARRNERELSTDELNALMRDAQRETYGDGLDEEILHPYMWAVKPHYYYSTRRLFYNYPYLFGLLFGLGLYTRYQQDPETFRKGYDDLLSSTGRADAATLAARFGIDLRSEAFWATCLDSIRQDITRFEVLTRNM